jgi:hypothetical protein
VSPGIGACVSDDRHAISCISGHTILDDAALIFCRILAPAWLAEHAQFIEKHALFEDRVTYTYQMADKRTEQIDCFDILDAL